MGWNVLLILPGWIKDGSMAGGMEVLSWLVYCQMALGPLVLADVWCWHSSWWGSCTAPETAPPGTWMKDSFPPAVSPHQPLLFWGFTLYWLSLLEFHYSSRSSWTGFKAVPGQLQASRVHLGHRKNLVGPLHRQTLDAQAAPTPALCWLSQPILTCSGMSQTLVHCVPKIKIKVSKSFH